VRQSQERWDVFCRIVDNFGDAGVAWRVARSLAREHGKRVRLWLSDLTVLAKLRPEIDPGKPRQKLEGVDIRLWAGEFSSNAAVPAREIADVVVETFGCDPPEGYVRAMAERKPMPRWINLEYLSAEDWVEASHELPSPHPRLAPLTKHYFFPGFTPRTGGLLRERDLLARRDAFQRDALTQAEFWRALTGEVPPEQALKVSLFGYAAAPFASLLDALARHAGPVWCVAPEGAASTALEHWLGGRRHGERGSVRAFAVEFLQQDRYDELLWACDLNFVRGEDSFVRGQWAARPFVWQAYPQDDGAHWIKIAAFLARYTRGLDRVHAAAVTRLWDAWNHARPMALPWAAFEARRSVLAGECVRWADGLAAQRELVDALTDFADNVLKC
jgi:uncharacterized repeat protein (TIGR03837 family)